MKNLIEIGKNILDKKNYFLDLIHKNGRLKIILGHMKKNKTILDFGKSYVDYRFSRELYRINDLKLDGLTDYWPVVEILDSKYLKKINEESCGLIFSVDKNVRHFLIYDDDYVIDIISTDAPKIIFKNNNPKV